MNKKTKVFIGGLVIGGAIGGLLGWVFTSSYLLNLLII